MRQRGGGGEGGSDDTCAIIDGMTALCTLDTATKGSAVTTALNEEGAAETAVPTSRLAIPMMTGSSALLRAAGSMRTESLGEDGPDDAVLSGCDGAVRCTVTEGGVPLVALAAGIAACSQRVLLFPLPGELGFDMVRYSISSSGLSGVLCSKPLPARLRGDD